MACIKGINQINRRDLQTLCNKRWLNDEVINMYMSVLQVQYARHLLN